METVTAQVGNIDRSTVAIAERVAALNTSQAAMGKNVDGLALKLAGAGELAQAAQELRDLTRELRSTLKQTQSLQRQLTTPPPDDHPVEEVKVIEDAKTERMKALLAFVQNPPAIVQLITYSLITAIATAFGIQMVQPPAPVQAPPPIAAPSGSSGGDSQTSEP
jgi:uncharacterized coiled-coil protein SlyX